MTINELSEGQTIKIECKTSYRCTETLVLKLTKESRGGFKAETEAGTRCKITQQTLSNPRNTITIIN